MQTLFGSSWSTLAVKREVAMNPSEPSWVWFAIKKTRHLKKRQEVKYTETISSINTDKVQRPRNTCTTSLHSKSQFLKFPLYNSTNPCTLLIFTHFITRNLLHGMIFIGQFECESRWSSSLLESLDTWKIFIYTAHMAMWIKIY